MAYAQKRAKGVEQANAAIRSVNSARATIEVTKTIETEAGEETVSDDIPTLRNLRRTGREFQVAVAQAGKEVAHVNEVAADTSPPVSLKILHADWLSKLRLCRNQLQNVSGAIDAALVDESLAKWNEAFVWEIPPPRNTAGVIDGPALKVLMAGSNGEEGEEKSGPWGGLIVFGMCLFWFGLLAAAGIGALANYLGEWAFEQIGGTRVLGLAADLLVAGGGFGLMGVVIMQHFNVYLTNLGGAASIWIALPLCAFLTWGIHLMCDYEGDNPQWESSRVNHHWVRAIIAIIAFSTCYLAPLAIGGAVL
ncbi:MAG: hypothetical protein ABL962_09755 [Fimbriimonadaceae bacterium]